MKRIFRVAGIILGCACFGLFLQVGLAQEIEKKASPEQEGLGKDALEMEEMVVTATRTEVPVRELGVSATVITAAEIERRQASDVSELLRDVAGLTIVRTGSQGGSVSLFPRGGENNFTLVMIDGVQVNLGGGDFNFDSTLDGNRQTIRHRKLTKLVFLDLRPISVDLDLTLSQTLQLDTRCGGFQFCVGHQ